MARASPLLLLLLARGALPASAQLVWLYDQLAYGASRSARGQQQQQRASSHRP
jgi:hypothetical protein